MSDHARFSATLFRTSLLPALFLALAACATASIEDAVPEGALSAPADSSADVAEAPALPPPDDAAALAATEPAGAEPGVADSSGAPRETGAYPDLNRAPGVAAAQMTPEEVQIKTEELRRSRAQAAGAAGGVRKGTEAARLRALGLSHGSEALKQIEGE